MKAEEFWPALETTALIRFVAERGEALAAAWQIPDRLVAAIGNHRFVLWAGGPTGTARCQLAAIGAANAVIQWIVRIRKIRIASHRRKRSRSGVFRGIRKIRS
jgi:HD-like signal output (HDOD) protein